MRKREGLCVYEREIKFDYIELAIRLKFEFKTWSNCYAPCAFFALYHLYNIKLKYYIYIFVLIYCDQCYTHPWKWNTVAMCFSCWVIIKPEPRKLRKLCRRVSILFPTNEEKVNKIEIKCCFRDKEDKFKKSFCKFKKSFLF